MIKEFLKEHGMSADNFDEKELIELFLVEMTTGLEGGGSLAMIPTYIYEPDLQTKPATDKKIVIDAGGTNFRSARAYFDENGKAVFEDMQKTAMPATETELSKEEFYDAIAENVKRLLPDTGDIGFCFSYPVDMGEDKDGIVGAATKEIKAPQIAGTKVGACTVEAIKKYDGKDRKIVILNDTVATLLGGMATAKKKYSAYIGYIYGTGTNLCYTEKAENIKKINAESGRRMLINTECGNFNCFELGDFDKNVCHLSKYRDKYHFEKMTSGKYLSQVINLCMDGARVEAVLPNKKKRCDFDLKDISEFLQSGGGAVAEAFEPEHREGAAQICEGLIERAAKMGAIVNAAAAIASGERDGLPVAIVAEGTTFNKLTGYREKFESYLEKFLIPYGITFEIIQGEDLNMLGSLMATL